MSKNTRFTTYRLCINGILTALFFVLSLLSFEVAGVKVTFDALPVVLAAILFGPVDGFLVGFLGAFLEQMIHYGFTATTLLWVLPPALRGLCLGLLLLPLHRKVLARSKAAVSLCFAATVLAGIVTSVGNTFVFYLDSTLYGYYNYAMVFGVFWWRILTGALVSVLVCPVSLAITAALQKAGLVKNRRSSHDD